MDDGQLMIKGGREVRTGRKRTWGIVFLCLMMIVALAGCKESASVDNKGNPSAADDKKPFTFTYFNAGTSKKNIEANQTKIGKIFEEQTGVNVKMEFLVGDINTKIGTMIASGQYPDVLVPDIAIDKVLDAKAFIPLNDLIDKHAPNLKKLYGPYLEQLKAEDGKIYFLPFGVNHGYIPNPDIDQGAFWIQRRVLKEFGYPKIKTLDEYFDLIAKYKEKHPETDGKPTIGFTALTYDWRFFVISNPPAHLAGYPNDGEVIVDMKTHEAKVYGNGEYTKRWLKKLNEINAAGLFDKEAFVSNYDEYLAKIASGRVLGFFDYGWQVNQALNSLLQAGNDDLRYMPLPIVFDKNIKDQYIDPPSFASNRGIGITVSAKDPVRIIKYFDNMAKEENQKLMTWGIKGETYEVDEKGRFYRTPEQIKKTSDEQFREQFGFSYFEWYWPRGNGLFSDGNAWEPRRQPEVAQASYTEGDKKILAAYGAKVFSDLFAKPDERPWYPAWSAPIKQGSPAQIYQQKKQDLQRKYFPKLVLDPPSKFEKNWKEYVKEYNKLDIKAFEDEITKYVKMKVEQSQK
ncbi:ABC transporter substrate-binding protein [Geobacillus stearothermophilus]|nr:ABC transporter substrate-binding protein [Geobacillus stearothermophilus]